MSSGTDSPASFTPTGGRSALDQVADQIADAPACPGSSDMIVVALRPASDRRRVVASTGNSAIRAAISVAVAAGNLRPWSAADAEAVTDVRVGALPEIIRATIAPHGIQSVRVGILHQSGEVACLTMWLSTAATISVEAERRHVDILRRLSDALEADYERVAALQQPNRAASTESIESTGPVAVADVTLPGRAAWVAALEQLDSDETGIIVLAVGGAEMLDHGGAGRVDRLRQSCANQLVAALPRGTCVARLEPDVYAVLLAATDRHGAFDASHRLRNGISLALAEVAADHLPVAVGFVHEDGLIDPEELFASAMSALGDARQSGGAKMLVAC